MSDEIPNEHYTRQCPNTNCNHMNLPWRTHCYICGVRLSDKTGCQCPCHKGIQGISHIMACHPNGYTKPKVWT